MTTRPPTRSLEASDVLDRLRHGDSRTWNALIADLGPVVRGLAIAKGVPDADDLTQDVFVAVASQISSFEGSTENFRSWVFTIAYRQIINRWRQGDRRTVELSPGMLTEDGESLEDSYIRSDTAGAAVEALDVLTDCERDVIILRVIAEVDTAQVAEMLETTPGNVRVIQTRALKKLRAGLVDRGYPGFADTGRKAG